MPNLMIKRGVLFLVLSTHFLAAFGSHSSDTTIIKSHLKAITKSEGYRNHQNIQELNRVADYIHQVFNQYADSAWFQEYSVNGKVYKNVICSFGTKHSERMIIGAHYDVCGRQEGADDNASGVVGLLELARMLEHQQLNKRVDLVAYTLEEPPYFRTEYMGSYVHAKSLIDQGVDVYGMLSVEMIGYFKDEKKSQGYPVGILSWVYGNRANYITLVKKFGAGKFARKFCKRFKASKSIRTKTFTAPTWVPGIDFSDHLNYWKFGISAMMITDTSFYRNKYYHEAGDTMETLDIRRMSQVVSGIYQGLLQMK